jgi:hypothetical protein
MTALDAVASAFSRPVASTSTVSILAAQVHLVGRSNPLPCQLVAESALTQQ